MTSFLQLGCQFGFRASRSSRRIPSASLPEICKITSAASKNVEFCSSDIGDTYGVSRTRQFAFTVPAVLPHSPVIPRRRCTRLFRVVCNPEPAVGECLFLSRSYSRAIQNLREMVFARVNAGIHTGA